MHISKSKFHGSFPDTPNVTVILNALERGHKTAPSHFFFSLFVSRDESIKKVISSLTTLGLTAVAKNNHAMAAIPPIAPGGPASPQALPALPTGPPSWRELFASADRMFIEPTVDYTTLSITLFTSADAPDILLSHVESLAQRSPVITSLIMDEEPKRVTLLKNPRCLAGSLANPSPLDGLLYGFSGSNSMTLAAVHLPVTAFETSAPFNVLDDPAAIWMGLDALPPNQMFHGCLRQCGNTGHDELRLLLSTCAANAVVHHPSSLP